VDAPSGPYDVSLTDLGGLTLPGVPTALALNTATGLLFVGVQPASLKAIVVVIDPTTDTIKTSIPVSGAMVRSIAVDPASNTIFATVQDGGPSSGVVTIIDGATNTVTGTIPTAAANEVAYYLAFNLTTHVLYSFNAIAGGGEGGTVSVIDPSARKTTATVPIPGACGPCGRAGAERLLDVDSVTNKIYAFSADSKLNVIDGTTNKITDTIAYSHAIAQSVAAESGGGLALVTTQSPDAVHEVDPADLPIPAGFTPDYVTYFDYFGVQGWSRVDVWAHDASGNVVVFTYAPCKPPKTGWGLDGEEHTDAAWVARGPAAGAALVTGVDVYVVERRSDSSGPLDPVLHHVRLHAATDRHLVSCP
jgi:DNA-binding beta-propeller fold protein YncE